MDTTGLAVHAPPFRNTGEDTLFQVIGRLRKHFEDLVGRDLPSIVVDDRLAGLRLAEAAVRYSRSGRSGRPPQIAILGPTQTGKSTLANLVCGREVAAVSPLAGFTVHAHGFWAAPEGADTDEDWIGEIFPGFTRQPSAELTRSELDHFTLTRIASPCEFGATSIVIWDSPDFDSLAAGSYQRALLELAALADVYVLVLSKEKYSDLSAWRMLGLLEPLRRPLIVVLNKLTADGAEPILQSLRNRFAELGGGWEPAAIQTVGYVPRSDQPASPEFRDAARRLRCELADRAGSCGASRSASERRDGVHALVRRHWEAWTAPVRQEHTALGQWHDLVSAAVEEFVRGYRRDYLDHPQRYDSFRRAALELLHLLEIPRISGWLTAARRVVTWPVRQAFSSGRGWIRDRSAGPARPHGLGTEATVLFEAMETMLTSLQRDVARRSSEASAGRSVWLALDDALRRDASRLSTSFEQAIAAHHDAVNRAIHGAANSLFEELKTHPARLGALRAARATIDVGSLLLVVKTGGLSPMDALYAPATFALTSLLTEGMAGMQMNHVARALKARQHEAVRRELVQGVLARELHRLGDDLQGSALFPITPDELEIAYAALSMEDAA